MKKITRTKLVLTQETVRNLSERELRFAGGGVGGARNGNKQPCTNNNSGCSNLGLTISENLPPDNV